MIVVFTDLDGTLLEHNLYSFAPAKNALALLREKKIPVVFVTSKTRKETEHWRKKTGNLHPFVCENGGAIFIPKNYFSFRVKGTKKIGGYDAIVYSPGIKTVRSALKKIKKKGFALKCLSEMGITEAMGFTGLNRKMVKLSLEREFEECFVLEKGGGKKLVKEIKSLGFEYFKGGRFHHIAKGHSKGKAVKELAWLYRKEFGKIETIGIGDSQNDFSMLKGVGRGILVKKSNGNYEPDSGRFEKAGGIGPEGWAKAVKKIMKKRVSAIAEKK
jgi:mannosyl-3-phosphoglycerate phosphatase